MCVSCGQISPEHGFDARQWMYRFPWRCLPAPDKENCVYPPALPLPPISAACIIQRAVRRQHRRQRYEVGLLQLLLALHRRHTSNTDDIVH